MRRLLLAAALLPMGARAERAPTEEEKAPIMRAVRAGMTAKAAMLAAIEDRNKSSNPEAALLHWSAARTAHGEMKSSFDLAIRLTQDTYGLKPEAPPEPHAAKPLSADGAWSAGLSAPWAPEYGEPGYREIRGSDGWLHYVSVNPEDSPAPDGVFAFTDPDGKVTILPSLFERIVHNNEPGLLANALHHEAVHYNDLITIGWDTHEQMEVRAGGATLATLDLFLPGLDSKVREGVKIALSKQLVVYEARVTAGNTRSPFANSVQEETYKRLFRQQKRRELEYHDLVRLVDRLRGNRREILEAARKNARWVKFNAWTLNACSYVGGIGPRDPEWGRPDLIRAREQRLRSYLRGNLVVIPSDEIDAGLERGDLLGSGELARCQSRMIGMIRELPAPVDADWILERIEYERSGGRVGEIISGVIESVRRAVADGTAALVRTATAPGTATRGDGDPVRDPSGGERESRLPTGDIYARDQLRGIDARGRWQD